MDLETKLLDEDRLEPVSATEVMRCWLADEVEDDPDAPDADALATEPGLREELIGREPIAGRVFAPEAATWYRTALSADELCDLRVVVGPESQGWRAVADDGRIETIAEHVLAADDASEFEGKSDEDLRKVRSLADDVAQSGPNGRLVVVQEGDEPAYVADGNHRAVAQVLVLLRGGETAERGVYFGTRADATARS